jgi:hypothetical protein
MNENVNMTVDTAMVAGASGGELFKSGITPGGGTAAGIWQRSVPGGNWEVISSFFLFFSLPTLFSFSAPRWRVFSIYGSGGRRLTSYNTIHIKI